MKHLNSILRCAFLTFVLSIFLSNSSYCQSLPPVNHEVSKDTALKYIHNFNASITDTAAVKGGAFHRAIIDKILAQKNCAGMRIYFAKLDNNMPTLVIVGIDKDGHDLTTGPIGETVMPCPPFCGALNP